MAANLTTAEPNLFARLSAELRVIIFEYALPSGGQFEHCTESAATSDRISLLFVDRITYQEALPIFIRSNFFIMTGTEILARADTSFSKNVTRLVIPGLDNLGDGDHSDRDQQLLKMLTSMPRLAGAMIDFGPSRSDKEELRHHSVREFFELKRRLPSTNLGETHSINCIDSGLYFLVPKQDTPSHPQIILVNAHYQAFSKFFTSYFTALVTSNQANEEEKNFLVDNFGELALDRMIAFGHMIDGVIGAQHGSEVSLPMPMARCWLDKGRTGSQVEDFKGDNGFGEALDECGQKYVYFEDGAESMAWVKVVR